MISWILTTQHEFLKFTHCLKEYDPVDHGQCLLLSVELLQSCTWSSSSTYVPLNPRKILTNGIDSSGWSPGWFRALEKLMCREAEGRVCSAWRWWGRRGSDHSLQLPWQCLEGKLSQASPKGAHITMAKVWAKGNSVSYDKIISW